MVILITNCTAFDWIVEVLRMVHSLEYSLYMLTTSQLAGGNCPSLWILLVPTPRKGAHGLFLETPEAPGLSVVSAHVIGASHSQGVQLPRWIRLPLDKLWAGGVGVLIEAPTVSVAHISCPPQLLHGWPLSTDIRTPLSTFYVFLRRAQCIPQGCAFLIQVELKDPRLTLARYNIGIHLCPAFPAI